MYKRAILLKLAKMTKEEPVLPKIGPICRISAENQGIDPDLLQKDPGKATDILMQRFLSGKIKKYDPDKDPKWQAMIGKSAAALGLNLMNKLDLDKRITDSKQAKEIQDRLPQSTTGIWARKHNSDNMQIHSPYHDAEIYNKIVHMTHQEDLMPGAGSRSQSLNTRQDITNPNTNYGPGRGNSYSQW